MRVFHRIELGRRGRCAQCVHRVGQGLFGGVERGLRCGQAVACGGGGLHQSVDLGVGGLFTGRGLGGRAIGVAVGCRDGGVERAEVGRGFVGGGCGVGRGCGGGLGRIGCGLQVARGLGQRGLRVFHRIELGRRGRCAQRVHGVGQGLFGVVKGGLRIGQVAAGIGRSLHQGVDLGVGGLFTGVGGVGRASGVAVGGADRSVERCEVGRCDVGAVGQRIGGIHRRLSSVGRGLQVARGLGERRLRVFHRIELSRRGRGAQRVHGVGQGLLSVVKGGLRIAQIAARGVGRVHQIF